MEKSRSAYHKKLRDYLLLLEYQKLKDQAPPGVYCVPSKNDLRVWHGIIFLRGGHYKNGVFRFVMHIPLEYPEIPPSIFFTTKVYNPCIDIRTGELDLSVQFPEWNASKNFILLIITFIKRIFYIPQLWDCPNPFNPSALASFKSDRRDFEVNCASCCADSSKKMYDPIDEREGCLLKYGKSIPAHEVIRNKIMSLANAPKPPNFSYLNWFIDGVDNIVHCPKSVSSLPVETTTTNVQNVVNSADKSLP